MRLQHIIIYILCVATTIYGCKSKQTTSNQANVNGDTVVPAPTPPKPKPLPVIVAAEDTAAYFHLLRNRRVGLTGNATTVAFGGHLVDLLLSKGIKITKIYSPEHGFRGDAEPGKRVVSGKDEKTGIEVVSLYGKISNRRQNI